MSPEIPLETLLSFIFEDAPFGDITTEAVLGNESCRAVIVARGEGIVAGLREAGRLFSARGIRAVTEKPDGVKVAPGEILITLQGPARAVLLVERTALNLIGRMSGIATRTRDLQDVLDRIRPGCRIASTRKTAPGLRLLDKKAVILGGGDPHRFSLSDGILIKDNHLTLVTIDEAIRRAKTRTRYKKVEVEVQTPEEAEQAARAGADMLLLDNMTPSAVRETIGRLRQAGLLKKLVIEVSGGIDELNLADYAVDGVDLISMGALTHSVKNFDVSMDLVKE